MLTLEVFCKRILDMCKPEDNITRKSVIGVAVKTLLLVGAVAAALGYLIGCVLPVIAGAGGFLLGVLVYFSLLDYISEDIYLYTGWAKVAKFWWLIMILSIVLILVMKLFLR